MALATQRLPAAALLMPALLLCEGDDQTAPFARTRDSWRPQLVRFTVRALEVHARDAGYLPGEWIAAGVVQAELSVLAVDGRAAIVVEHLEDAARAIAAASIATENDVMAVPEHLSGALGAALGALRDYHRRLEFIVATPRPRAATASPPSGSRSRRTIARAAPDRSAAAW